MKYIDADRLRAEIEKRLKNVHDYMNGAGMKYKGPKYFKAQGKESVYDALLNIIASLQQEQPESSKGKFVFPNFLYARTVDNKTIDVSYAPQSLDAVEYIKNDPTDMWTQRPPEERKFSELDEHEEYIRKDALLEWLQQGFDWIENPVISAQQIIDKLNSM